MRRCPITYEPLAESEARYSAAGLRLLSRTLHGLSDLPWSAAEQRREAAARAARLSIQGVQPKLSARLRPKEGQVALVDKGGEFILKPQVELYPHLPENEDLTMRLASAVGIDVPLHGLVRSIDGSWTYFIRRFDRLPRGRKVAVEDFAQLSGGTRATKYDSSMERVAGLLERFATFPLVEKRELFLRTLFSFLVGNEDMHLKNFSVVVRDDVVRLSPAYDLVSSTLALPRATEELALPLHGRKRRLSRADLVDYFGAERLGLTRVVIDDVLGRFAAAEGRWTQLLRASFLPASVQDRYLALMRERRQRLALD